MAGTTTNYAFPYPTSTDLVRNGASAIQSLADSIDSFIGGSEAAGKLFDVATSLNTNSTSITATTPTAIPSTGAHSLTFTTGKSGLFAVVVQARMSNGLATNTCHISPSITGALTSTASANRAGMVGGTQYGTGTFVYFYDGTGSTSTTVELQAWVTGGTGTVTWSNITVLTMG